MARSPMGVGNCQDFHELVTLAKNHKVREGPQPCPSRAIAMAREPERDLHNVVQDGVGMEAEVQRD